MESTEKFSKYSSNLVIEGSINYSLFIRNNRGKLNTFAYGVF